MFPTDSGCQKLRTCKYLVLRDYEGEMKHNLYTDDGDEWDYDYDPAEDDDDATDNNAVSITVNKGESYRWN